MAVGNWAGTTLCTTEDLKNYQDDVLDLVTVEEAQKKIDLIKEEMACRLRPVIIRTLDRNGISKSKWPDEVCDLIENPEVFKNANIAGALYLIFEDQIVADAAYALDKRETYRVKYLEERNYAENRFHLDEDASGDVIAEERLTLRGFVRIIC
jgi:hypothetical protein